MADNDKTSTKSAPLPWIVLSGFLGIFAVGAPALNNAAKDKNANKKDAETAAIQERDKSPLKPISDFYATHDGEWKPEVDLRRQLHNYQVEFLIATVPDPIDSPYGFAFDQVIDAIQRAVEKKDGYILDRSWLPWELDKKAKRAKADEKGPQAGSLRESLPGVLVFRHSRHPTWKNKLPGLLIVFLVGETPMSGLHKQAFTKALKIMAKTGRAGAEPVRVIGPYFSGSQTSLQFILGDWWATIDEKMAGTAPYRFDIISGNASALNWKYFFDLDPKSDGHPHWQPANVTLSATVVPTRLVISATLRYLARRDGCKSDEFISSKGATRLPGKVSILAESNTSFGKMFSNGNQLDEFLLLRFPLHISRVKNEYTEAFRKKDEQSGLKATDTFVPSTFEETNPSNEGVPAQGGATTTAVNAQVLSNILTTISREQCRYVGIVASDTRDKLFLIRLIREHCPDVTIFVTDADQLLLHPDYQYQMRGVVVGSTYPLLADNQRWVNPKSTERILFPSTGAQGYYNAALLHLGLNKHLQEYAPPRFAIADRAADSHPKILQRPPIWISVASPNGTLIPLQVFTEYDDAQGLMRLNDEASEAKDLPGLSYPGALLPIGAALLAFWIFLVYQALFTRSSRMFWEPVSAKGEFSLPQLCYRNVILGSQAILSVPLLAIIATHADANGHQATWTTAVLVLTAMLLAGFILGMFKPLCWPLSRLLQFTHWLRPAKLSAGRMELWTWAIINVALVAMVAGFAALFLGRFWIYGGSTRRMLFFLRAVDLSTGLSPLTPLFFMCMGFLAWSYFQLKRAQQIDRYSVPPPFPAGVGNSTHEGTFSRINDLDRMVQEEVRHENSAVRHPKAIALTVLALSALGLAIWLHSLPSIEGWSWDGLFFTGFWVMFALSVATQVRLFYLWKSTKRLLDAISLVPMMRAFARLPPKISDVFGKYLSTQRPRLEHLQLPIHQLRLLSAATAHSSDVPEELADLGRVTQALDDRLQEGLYLAADNGVAQRVERDLRGKLSAVAANCLTALAPRWKNLPVEDAYGDGAGKGKDDQPKPSDAPTEPTWVPLAENVVATQIIIYVSQFFAQLRSLVVATMVCTSLLLFAATSYPFHPEHLLLVCLIGLSVAGIAAVIWVLIEMNRDEVVSRIFKTTPGKFSFDSGIIGSFLTYIVPTISLLAAQLSGSFRWILEPLLRVMK